MLGIPSPISHGAVNLHQNPDKCGFPHSHDRPNSRFLLFNYCIYFTLSCGVDTWVTAVGLYSA